MLFPSCPFSSTLRHPRDSRHTHIPKGNLVYLVYITTAVCINAFFCTSAFCSLPAAGLSCVLGSGARREPARTPRRKRGPWLRPIARALGFQSHMKPRGGILSTYSHPGPCKPTYRSNKCPTAHVISRIFNVVNVVRHCLVMERLYPRPTCESCDHF